MSRTPLIWFGGKGKQADLIISKMPSHKVYVEPFGGAAHVISRKPRVSHEVYNDIDGSVVNFIMQAIDRPNDLAETCQQLPYSRELFEKWKREPLPRDPFDQAVRFFYLNRSAISRGNAEEVPNTGWRHSTTSSQNPAMGYVNACKAIQDFSKRMQGVMIEKKDFREIIQKYDTAEALIYVDPPYIGREKYYAGGFSEKDHIELAEMLNSCKAKVMISYYQDPLLKNLYKNWFVETHQAFKQVVGGENMGAPAEELLIMNYEIKQLTLF